MNTEKYLLNFFRSTKNPDLKAMKYFMHEFGHPEKNLKIIHIAGTNGKGSCTEMIVNILTKAGYKVGKFIGPHLIKFNERISIGNKQISDSEMEKLIKKIQPKIDKYNSENNIKVTFFELETTMALMYFYANNCDFVVLETGLGGLYDCTNIVNPLISIITNIGYDHMNILGNTLEEIAKQKAGIIKQNSDTIFVKQDENTVNKIIEQVCMEKNNKLHLIKEQDISNYSYSKDFQKFDYKNHKDMVINLKGKKQIYNASICIECIDILKNTFNIPEKALLDGLKTVIHKGRFEVLNKNPLIIFDGAHNEPAIENLMNNIDMYYKDRKKIYVISISKRKDYKAMLKQLAKDKNSVFIFTDGNDKKEYVPKEELLEVGKKYINSENLYIEDLEHAIELVKKKFKNQVVFIVGSFYVYGTVLKYINEDNSFPTRFVPKKGM